MEEDFLEQTRGRDVDLFVCSDAEAILGIGDQGVGVSRNVSFRHLLKTIETICRASVYANSQNIAGSALNSRLTAINRYHQQSCLFTRELCWLSFLGIFCQMH